MTLTTEAAAQQTAAGETQARSVSFFVFFLRFTEPGGITVPGGVNQRAHLLLDTDAEGRPQLPGTSLAGALREMIRAERGKDAAAELFGRLLPPGGDGAEVDAQASQIWVLGSRPDGSESGEVRASTTISRFRGAAKGNTLRTEEVLPAGSRFEVFLRWDDAAPGEVADFAGRLAAWRPFIGRGISRGRGRCTAEDVRHGTLRLDQPDDLLRWLTASGPDLARAVATEAVAAPAGTAGDEPLLRVMISVAGPCRTGNGEEPEDQLIPLFRVAGVPVLPGTGLKGLLRSRAEFILRSTGVTPAPCQDQRCGTCWACQVFGFGGGQDVASTSVGARSAIRITDAAVHDPVVVRRTHIALDRFTGGVLPGALYQMEALESGTFTLEVQHLSALSPRRVSEIRALFRLVLEDLEDGITGIGGGTARGYGSVSVGFGDAESSGGLPGPAEARQILAQMTEER
jgi:CRISPR/Cas system CSM-associated protein Csm3 (group 7 of RAMP superfamily)